MIIHQLCYILLVSKKSLNLPTFQNRGLYKFGEVEIIGIIQSLSATDSKPTHAGQLIVNYATNGKKSYLHFKKTTGFCQEIGSCLSKENF
jgi:hypothetical protein